MVIDRQCDAGLNDGTVQPKLVQRVELENVHRTLSHIQSTFPRYASCILRWVYLPYDYGKISSSDEPLRTRETMDEIDVVITARGYAVLQLEALSQATGVRCVRGLLQTVHNLYKSLNSQETRRLFSITVGQYALAIERLLQRNLAC